MITINTVEISSHTSGHKAFYAPHPVFPIRVRSEAEPHTQPLGSWCVISISPLIVICAPAVAR